MKPEQKVASWQLSSYHGELSALPDLGRRCPGSHLPGGHLSLPGLEATMGLQGEEEKKVCPSTEDVW